MRGLVLAALAAAACAGGIGVEFNVNSQSGAYTIDIGGSTWFSSAIGAPVAVREGGKLLTPGNGGLKLSSVRTSSGNGVYGAYTETTMTWNGGLAITSAQVYPSASAIVFTQTYPAGLQGTSAGNGSTAAQDLITAFPTTTVGNTAAGSPLAYLSWADCMSGGHLNSWSSGGISGNHGGSNGGVFAVFNQSLATVFISSLDNFMVSGGAFASSIGTGVFGTGAFGPVASVPAGWTFSSILVAGQGINDTSMAWGDLLLQASGKKRTTLQQDFQTSYLSYWTDNGAYYYYQTEPNATYEQTILDVITYYRDEVQLPLRALQFDSWWYYKIGGNVGKGAVTLWEPMPEVFPDGLKPWTALPLALHNRYFAINNSYIGMGYEFIIEPGADIALPVDKGMFKYIMQRTQPWGMTLYEQDWLNVVYNSLYTTQSNVTAAHIWLQAMSDAAAELGVTIQYCMPLPIHMMESTLHQPVTNARASGDYHPGSDQWAIGLSSLFYHAIGIQPSKDDFWTTQYQAGNPYGDNPNEPNTFLQAAVALLSTGPVGPSDAVGKADSDIILRTIRKGDGMLLKPDRPAITMDKALQVAAFGSGEEGAELPIEALAVTGGDITVPDVLHTYSAQGPAGEYRWHYLLAVRVRSAIAVTFSDIQGSAPTAASSYAVVDYFNVNGGPIAMLNAATPFTIPTGQGWPNSNPGAHTLRYYVLAPVLPNGWVWLGEMEKIATMSGMRTSNMTFTAQGLTATVHSANSETAVNYNYAAPDGKGGWVIKSFTCAVSMGIDASLTCTSAGCTCA